MAEQPWAVLATVASLLGYARDFDVFQELKEKAPPRVRARVLATAAKSVARAH